VAACERRARDLTAIHDALLRLAADPET
jgi:hypothetical protein